jgi:2'-5' RNA ligase
MMFLGDRTKEVKLKYTHFVCFPLIGSTDFQNRIESIKSYTKDPIIKAAAIPVEKMHFTICMLRIISQSDMEKIKNILSEFRQLCGGNPIPVDLVGIQSIQEDSSHSRVLFTGGHVSGAGWRERLMDVGSRVISRLQEEGLIDSQTRDHIDSSQKTVQLHATLFNIKYAIGRVNGVEDSSDDEKPRNEWMPDMQNMRNSSKRSFDASSLVDRFHDMRFGKVNVDELRLCSLVDQPSKGSDGFYSTDLVVKL